ncbi:hypothetical protein EMCG_06060 [[Emmonsia] crescens]|uniref:Uncharacterized protein n=1 Tax=[Emmonsia] crescens TaxID=73230 RepID=A0A0G2IC52_9EURO|nr:hypothetical protein EMCG_06060 [Emmonsia crescens UAMH 3008]
MIAQVLFKACAVLFLSKSVVLALPSSSSRHASDSTGLTTPLKPINAPKIEPLAKFIGLALEKGTEHYAENTNLNPVPELQRRKKSQKKSRPLSKKPRPLHTYEDMEVRPQSIYEKGTCSIHVWETQLCGSDYKNGDELYIFIDLKDNNGQNIGYSGVDSSGLGERFDAGNSIGVTSKLPWVLVAQNHKNGDYIEFKYGKYTWTSGTTGSKGREEVFCQRGGWDPREAWWYCSLNKAERRRQMDCFFPC